MSVRKLHDTNVNQEPGFKSLGKGMYTSPVGRILAKESIEVRIRTKVE